MSKKLSKSTKMEEALRESLVLLSPIKRPPAQPQTPPPSSKSSTSALSLRTKKLRTALSSSPPTQQTPHTPRSQTVREPTTPMTLPAPRKRSFSDYDADSEAVTPPKRIRTTPTTPQSTPSKPRRGRKKEILRLDREICIPMHVLRAQKDDTSALLRPLPRPSDALRKLVDLSVARQLEKIRKPGCTGILDAAVWVGRKREGGLKKVEDVTGSLQSKRAGSKKT